MTELLDTLLPFDDAVLRNRVGVNLAIEPFDDLSDLPSDWDEANKIITQVNLSRLSDSELHFYAIGKIFSRENWKKTRFGDGSFPIWYGSLDVETTFFETAFHWRRTLLTDAGFLNKPGPIYMARTVFKTMCTSTLIDFRKKAQDFPELIHQDVNQYTITQNLGLKLHREGFPGFLTLSARKQYGENIIVFNKIVLHTPEHYQDYLYEILPENKFQINVIDFQTRQLLLSIE